jgi:hypothetical protein
MSRINDFEESQEDERELIAVLEALINAEKLQGAALGIAKKVIADKGEEKLTSKQKEVYSNVIEPMFSMTCSNADCDQQIAFSDMPEAIANHAMGDSVECSNCQYYRHQMAKDD